MKNFQQTPKQIRKDLSKQRHMLKTSAPRITFAHEHSSHWGYGMFKLHNHVYHEDKRK